MKRNEDSQVWSELESFAAELGRERRLERAFSNPRLKELYLPVVEFTNAFIPMVRLFQPGLGVRQIERVEQARPYLEQASQSLVEAVFLALCGLYSSSCLIFRGYVEAMFRSLCTDEEAFDRLAPSRKAELNRKGFSVTIRDYRDALEKSGCSRENTRTLYSVYFLLSLIAHWRALPFDAWRGFLDSLGKFNESDARDVSLLMTEGCRAGGALFRERFSAVLQTGHLGKSGAFDVSLGRLTPVPPAAINLIVRSRKPAKRSNVWKTTAAPRGSEATDCRQADPS